MIKTSLFWNQSPICTSKPAIQNISDEKRDLCELDLSKKDILFKQSQI